MAADMSQVHPWARHQMYSHVGPAGDPCISMSALPIHCQAFSCLALFQVRAHGQQCVHSRSGLLCQHPNMDCAVLLLQ